MSMKKVIAILLCTISTVSCAGTPFEVFCDKFPQLSLPIYANFSEPPETKELYYFQLDKVSPITEDEFWKYIKTSRWGEFQRPSDSLLYIYHYVPAGRINYGQYIVLFINCGYMPEPKKYEDSDIGAYENMLCIYTQDGCRTDSIIFSRATCVSNLNGKFAMEWKGDMPATFDKGTMSANGEIVISRYMDNELKPYCVDTMYIDHNSGKIMRK